MKLKKGIGVAFASLLIAIVAFAVSAEPSEATGGGHHGPPDLCTILPFLPMCDEEPTPTPTVTPTPTEEPTSTPTPTVEPTSTPEPTAEPTQTPEPTSTPEATPSPTSTPVPCCDEEPEPDPTPVSTPASTPVPTSTPEIVLTPTPDELCVAAFGRPCEVVSIPEVPGVVVTPPETAEPPRVLDSSLAPRAPKTGNAGLLDGKSEASSWVVATIALVSLGAVVGTRAYAGRHSRR